MEESAQNKLDKQKLEEELAEYDIDTLKMIHETQTDEYSPEELDYMLEIIQRKEAELLEKAEAYIPEEIVCEKCGVAQPFSNDKCQYCEWEFDKSEYYRQANLEAQGLAHYGSEDDARQSSTEQDGSSSYTFHYVISFLIPIVGLIMGAVFLTKDSQEGRSVGKTCILAAIIGMVISVSITSCVFVGFSRY